VNSQIIIESRIDAIDDVYQWLQKKLDAEDIASKLLNSILLVTQEMVTNSVIHGNREAINKYVTTTLYSTSEQIIIEIQDEGEGILSLPTKDEAQELDYLAENGRGLKLTVLMTDEIELDGNRMKLMFNRDNNI